MLLGRPVQSIRDEIKRRGFVHLRGFVPLAPLEAARGRALEIGQLMGFLEEATDVATLKRKKLRVTFRDQIIFAANLKRTRAYQRLLADPEMKARLTRILGDWRYYQPALDDAGVWARFVGPTAKNPVLPPHQDAHYHGPHRTIFGFWFPLEDCPRKLGGLALKPYSHVDGCLEHSRGFLPMKVGPGWYVGHYRPGDCLIFSNLCVHGAWRNDYADRARLSIDCRLIVRGPTLPKLRPPYPANT